MTDKEIDELEYSVRRFQCNKDHFHFNSIAEEMKVTGLVLICNILFAILKEIKRHKGYRDDRCKEDEK